MKRAGTRNVFFKTQMEGMAMRYREGGSGEGVFGSTDLALKIAWIADFCSTEIERVGVF